MTFNDLPQIAKLVARSAMASAKDKNHLTRILDTEPEFRAAIGVTDPDVYPKEVDLVVRYYQAGTEPTIVHIKDLAGYRWSMCMDEAEKGLDAHWTDVEFYDEMGSTTTPPGTHRYTILSAQEVDSLKRTAFEIITATKET